MAMRRRASLAGLETQNGTQYKPAAGGSFGRRMSLASLGAGKYGRAFDSYSDGVRDESVQVIVRHIPIVIEGDEEDSAGQMGNKDEVKVPVNYSQSFLSFPQVRSTRSWSLADDRSSLSSVSSDNSVESSRRKDTGEDILRVLGTLRGVETSNPSYQSWDDWSQSGRKLKEVMDNECEETGGLRTPFKDITQNKDLNNKSKNTRKTSQLGTKYLLKTETVGVQNCPVHGEGERGKINTFRGGKKNSTHELTSGSLKSPSLINSKGAKLSKVYPDKKSSTIEPGRPKYNTNSIRKPSRLGEEPTEINRLERGPGQWSFRGTRSKINSAKQKDEENRNEDQKKAPVAFHRRWSFRKPSLTPKEKDSDTTMSFQAPTISSLSRSVTGPIQLPEYFRGASNACQEKQTLSMKKYSSQEDLNSNYIKTSSTSLAASNLRITPSSSTSSIPSKVSKEFLHITNGKQPCTGILKTHGKRKISSNNRVEFLNNIMEREIPSRHT